MQMCGESEGPAAWMGRARRGRKKGLVGWPARTRVLRRKERRVEAGNEGNKNEERGE